jgi:hypothetical protein
VLLASIIGEKALKKAPEMSKKQIQAERIAIVLKVNILNIKSPRIIDMKNFFKKHKQMFAFFRIMCYYTIFSLIIQLFCGGKCNI